jgi:hypothetical protein
MRLDLLSGTSYSAFSVRWKALNRAPANKLPWLESQSVSQGSLQLGGVSRTEGRAGDLGNLGFQLMKLP